MVFILHNMHLYVYIPTVNSCKQFKVAEKNISKNLCKTRIVKPTKITIFKKLLEANTLLIQNICHKGVIGNYIVYCNKKKISWDLVLVKHTV